MGVILVIYNQIEGSRTRTGVSMKRGSPLDFRVADGSRPLQRAAAAPTGITEQSSLRPTALAGTGQNL